MSTTTGELWAQASGVRLLKKNSCLFINVQFTECHGAFSFWIYHVFQTLITVIEWTVAFNSCCISCIFVQLLTIILLLILHFLNLNIYFTLPNEFMLISMSFPWSVILVSGMDIYVFLCLISSISCCSQHWGQLLNKSRVTRWDKWHSTWVFTTPLSLYHKGEYSFINQCQCNTMLSFFQLFWYCLFLVRELIWQKTSIYHKAHNIFKFDCEVKWKSVPRTNQFWAMRVKCFAHESNRSLIGVKLKTDQYQSEALNHCVTPLHYIQLCFFLDVDVYNVDLHWLAVWASSICPNCLSVMLSV